MQNDKEVVKECLTRYRAGDTEALADLVEAYRRPLYAYLLRMTEGREDPDELFQEVWFRAIRNLHRYRHDKLLSWLFRIAHNLVIDRARKKKPDRNLEETNEDGLTLLDRLPDQQIGPDRQSENADLGEKIHSEVQQLPEEQREVFIMRTESDLSFKEIAKIQKVSVNTALGRMHYAVTRLRENLGDVYAQYNEAAS